MVLPFADVRLRCVGVSNVWGCGVSGLPIWVHIVAVLVLLVLLTYSIVILGPEGYPATVIVGGLLGAYAGLNELVKRKGSDGK